MMNQFEVPACLVDQLPGIKTELRQTYPSLNIFRTIQCLVNHTKRNILQHDLQTVKKCLLAAEYIYAKGNTQVKKAIENVFVYSLSSLMHTGDKEERKQVQAAIPLHLYTAYVQQVLKPGL